MKKAVIVIFFTGYFAMFCLAQHRTLPESLTGTWVADTARVVVRTDRGWMKFNPNYAIGDARASNYLR